ncbi:MAG: hypothetical protein AB8C13_05085 [Phycisphaerales bacterium]
MSHSIYSVGHRIASRKYETRRGNLLVGCGVVLAVLVVLAVIAVVVVMMNWRSWTANASTQMINSVITQSKIDPAEQAEIMDHIESLMTRFENKEVSMEQMGMVLEQLVESPVVASALVIGLDNLYFAESTLSDEEKAQGRIELARFTQGLFDETIQPPAINEVLAPVITNTPDSNDIKLNLKLDSNGRSITALKSSDEVTDEDLRTLIATAKIKADEAEIDETPVEVDLSDELGRAIGIALGDIVEEDPEPAPSTPAADPSATPGSDPIDDDGP